MTGHSGCVNTLQWNHTGTRLLSGSDDCNFKLWNPYAEECLVASTPSEHTANIFAARYMNDGDSRIASCSANGAVRFTALNELGDKIINGLFSCHTDIAFDVRPDPVDSNVFFSISDDGTVKQYDTRTATSCNCDGCSRYTILDINKLTKKRKLSKTSHTHENDESQTKPEERDQVDEENDETPFARGGRASFINLIFPPDEFKGVAALSFNPSQPVQMALGCSDGFVRIYDRRFIRPAGGDWEDESLIKEVKGSHVYSFRPANFNDGSRRHKITSLVYDPSGSGELLVSYSGEKVYLCHPNLALNRDEDDADVVAFYGGHRNERTIIKEACFYGSGSEFVMSGSDDGRLYVWDKGSRELVNVLKCDKLQTLMIPCWQSQESITTSSFFYLLHKNPGPVKTSNLCRSLAALARIDDLEFDLDTVDQELDGIAETSLPRPSTSIKRVATAQNRSQDPAAAASSFSVRPLSGRGRVVTGYARPLTSTRDLTGSDRSLNRTGTGRVTLSSAGRAGLMTPSLINEPGGPFINLDRLDLKKYSTKAVLSKALFEYIFDHCGDMKKALELASHALTSSNYKNWWWKLQIGRCFLRLNLFKDAERYLQSSLKEQVIYFSVAQSSNEHSKDMLITRQYLGKLFLKLGQTNSALQVYKEATEAFPYATAPLTRLARLHEEMYNLSMSITIYKKILSIDSSNVEALASLAANYFYDDQPEIALRYYRRLLQMGKEKCAEIWNNLGLCSFYSQQYDLAIPCFERALACSTNDQMLADVWYNVGHVACSTGDLDFAYKCFKICITCNSNHAEGWNNLGVLEVQMAKSMVTAQDHFLRSSTLSSYIYEPFYNLALTHLHMALGTFVWSTAVNNYSQVDRLWSITPFVYSWVFLASAYVKGYGLDTRLLAMALLSTAWGFRLTYNFWRKGGYKAGDEDYRWPALRKIITNKILWHTFAFTFISCYQNILLLLIAIPGQIAFEAAEARAKGLPVPDAWNFFDTFGTALFVTLLTIETIADQQQWVFQEKKWSMLKAGKALATLPEPYKYGFLTEGLFKYCRHPNFFAEFSQWWAFYIFSVAASGAVLNWTISGAVLLTLLFLGSTEFTEYITKSKYPLYERASKPSASGAREHRHSTVKNFTANADSKVAKKLVFKSFKVQPKVPEEYEREAWEKLKCAVESIYGNVRVGESLEELYKACENLCLQKRAATVYSKLHSLCEAQVLKELARLKQTYVLQTANLKSIWELGLFIFRTHIISEPSLKAATVSGLLDLIERDRSGDIVSRDLLGSIIRMFVDLNMYTTDFEAPFLSRTELYYLDEGDKIVGEFPDTEGWLAVSRYLHHIDSRIKQESARCATGTGYLIHSTRKPLIAVLERVLCQRHMKTCLSKGFNGLVNTNQIDDLRLLYNLFVRVDGMEEMRKAFGSYIVESGKAIVIDPSRDQDMVLSLLQLRLQIDTVVTESFANDPEMVRAVKESFENFINQRPNKPAEMIAKHIDGLLRASKGITEEEVENTLEKCLVLFRYINGTVYAPFQSLSN
ncbi:Cullin-4B [Phlyctochytrium planicorne]|nr:Cullin-4B [Phlyctochytrium planicorne]